MSHDPQPLGGKIISKPVMIFGPLIVICMLLIVKRLVFGLGSVSDLNGGFPWGVWIAFDLLIGTGFACGGWALAWAVYVFNRGQYHPLVRPALVQAHYRRNKGAYSLADEKQAVSQPPEDTPDKNVGDFDGAFTSAAVKIDATYTTPDQSHMAREPHASMAVWDGKRRAIAQGTRLALEI